MWLRNTEFKLPSELPKLQLYDYIFLNSLVEIYGEKTSTSVVEMLRRIPIIPGLKYGEHFFREAIAKKLKIKINLKEMKGKIDSYKTRAELAIYLMSKRKELEMVWYLTKGSAFFSHNNDKFNVPLDVEEIGEEDFIGPTLESLIEYEEKYHCVKASVLRRV